MDAEAVKVHVVAMPAPPATKERRTSFGTHTLPGTATTVEHLRILPHAPNRIRASVTVVGQSNVVGYLCASKADAQSLSGSLVMPPQVLELKGSDEVWVSAPIGTNIAFGVTPEYCP